MFEIGKDGFKKFAPRRRLIFGSDGPSSPQCGRMWACLSGSPTLPQVGWLRPTEIGEPPQADRGPILQPCQANFGTGELAAAWVREANTAFRRARAISLWKLHFLWFDSRGKGCFS